MQTPTQWICLVVVRSTEVVTGVRRVKLVVVRCMVDDA